MNCKTSEKLIMKYVDGEISEDEARLLNSHITQCSSCRADFYFYDGLIKSLNEFEEIEAPVTFEAEVMAKINALDYNYAGSGYRTEHKVFNVVLGVFSVIMGGGVVLFIFREPILNALLGSEQSSPYYSKLVEISDFAGELWVSLKNSVAGAVSSANGAIGAYMGIIIMLIIAVVVLQGFLLYKKRR